MADFYLIGIYGEAGSYPIDLTPHPFADCLRMMRWQGPSWHGAICRPVAGERGLFEESGTGRRLLCLDRGGWTVEAWNAFLNRVWPPKREADEAARLDAVATSTRAEVER